MKKNVNELNKSEDPRAKEVVAYVRVSTKRQKDEGYSLPAQTKLIEEYAKKHDFKIIKWFQEAESASELGRKEFGKMLEFFEKNQWCKTLLCEKADRLSRNYKDVSKIEDLDLEVHFVISGRIFASADLDNIDDALTTDFDFMMARHNKRRLRKEVKKGMKEKAEEGLFPSCAPLGYRNAPDSNGNRTIEPDPIRAPLVKRLFEEFSTGKYTLKGMSKKCLELGLFTRKDKAIPKSNVYKYLKNKAYTGDFNWDGIEYQGKYEPIISKELWERVQGVLDGRYVVRTRYVKNRFTYSGLVTCGHCGCALVGELQGRNKEYLYYHCTGNRGPCPEPHYTREEILESEFAKHLKNLKVSEKLLPLIVKNLKESHAKEKEFHNNTLGRLEADYQKYQNRIDKAYADKLDGKIDDHYYKNRFNEYRAEQEKISQAIESLRLNNTSYLDSGIQVLRLASKAHELFQKQTSEEKKELLRVMMGISSWKEGRLIPKFNPLFEGILHSNKENIIKTPSNEEFDGVNEKWLPGLDSNHPNH